VVLKTRVFSARSLIFFFLAVDETIVWDATCLQASVACTVDAQMCKVVTMSRPHPQAVVAIDGQYVEFVEEIRPTGKKTVISQRHSLRL
jgi:hypothetical protein